MNHKGDYISAHGILRELLSTSKEQFADGELEYWCGVSAERMNRPDEAATWLERAYRLTDRKKTSPADLAFMLFEYAYVLKQLDRREEFLAICSEVETHIGQLREREISVFYGMKGQLLQELERYDKALVSTRRAVEAASSQPDCTADFLSRLKVQAARNLIGLGQYEEALRELEHVAIKPLDSWCRYLYFAAVSRSLWELERHDAVIKPLRKMLSADWWNRLPAGTRSEHAKMLAVAYWKTGKVRKARKLFRQLVDAPEANPEDVRIAKEYFDKS